jgi:hypothetical protein
MQPRTLTMVRRPPSLRGVPPRYQVFDRRMQPPMTVARFYRDADQDGVVFEVYEDDFRELLKREPALAGTRFTWLLDVDPDSPGDTISAVVRPEPMPVPETRGDPDARKLTLEEALETFRGNERYRVTRTSDPL